MDSSNRPLEDQSPKVGATILMKVNVPPTMDETSHYQSPRECVTHIDHIDQRVAWRYVSLPSWLLNATRWQWLTDQNGKTKYDSLEVFKGPAAYFVKWLYGRGLVQGVDEMAKGLKARAESSE